MRENLPDLEDEVLGRVPRADGGLALILDLGEGDLLTRDGRGRLDVIRVVVLLDIVERVGPASGGGLKGLGRVLLLLVDAVVHDVVGSADLASVGGGLTPPESRAEEKVVEAEGCERKRP